MRGAGLRRGARRRGRRALVAAALALDLAITLAIAPGAAAAVRPFAASRGGWLHGAWTDGAVLATYGFDDVVLTCRTGQVSVAPTGGSQGLRGITAVAGGGLGEARSYAAIAEAGGVARWRGGRWELLQAPAIERETLTALVIDDAGRLLAAGERHALYILDGDQWTVHRYPRAEMAAAGVRAMIRLGERDLLLAGDDGLLLTFRGGELRRHRLPAGALTGDLQAAWASPASEVVWLASGSDLIRLDLRRGTARSVDVPLFGRVGAIAGVHTPQGDRLVVAAQSELALYDGARFLRIAGEYVFAEGLAIDGHDASLFVASRDGLRHLNLDEPGLRALAWSIGPPEPCPLPGEATAEDEAAATAATATATAAIGGEAAPSGPTTTPATTTAALTPIEAERRRPRMHMPSLRLSMGPAMVADPAGGVRTSFALDLFLGAQLGVRPRLAIWPEIGYAHSRSPISGGHLIAAGVAPLYGGKIAGVAVMPKVLVGSAGDVFAVGVRSSVIGTFLLDVLSLEVGHQWLRFGGEDVHEGRLMFSINLLPVLGVWMMMGIFRALRRR